MSMHQVMATLSEAKFGEDEIDYFERQVQEHGERGEIVNLSDLCEACRLKFKQMEVNHLLARMADGDQAALGRAVHLLLKEVFFL